MSRLFWILFTLVLLSPLPLGSWPAWAWTLMSTVVAALLMVWALHMAAYRTTPPVAVARIRFVVVPFALTALWIALQMTTLTPEWLHHPIWGVASIALERDLPGAISVNPFVTGDGLVRLLTFGGVFWLSLQFCRDTRRAEQVFHGIALAGLVYAAYGLIVQFTGSDTILWYHKRHYVGSVTSTIEYKNAYATYAGLGLICTIGLLVRAVDDASRNVNGPRERLRRVVSRIIEEGWILVLGCILLATALLLTNSRAGFLATAAAIVALLYSMAYARRGRSPYLTKLTAAVVVGGIGLVAFSGDKVLDRLDRLNPQTDTRTQIYALTAEAISDTPWLGTGYRTFNDTFEMYRTIELGTPVQRAHNAYLDNALGLGIPAALALTVAAAGLAAICIRGLSRRRNVIFPCIGLAATALVGVHALFDFTMQVPAVSVTYFLLMGAACAQSWSTAERRRRRSAGTRQVVQP